MEATSYREYLRGLRLATLEAANATAFHSLEHFFNELVIPIRELKQELEKDAAELINNTIQASWTIQLNRVLDTKTEKNTNLVYYVAGKTKMNRLVLSRTGVLENAAVASDLFLGDELPAINHIRQELIEAFPECLIDTEFITDDVIGIRFIIKYYCD